MDIPKKIKLYNYDIDIKRFKKIKKHWGKCDFHKYKIEVVDDSIFKDKNQKKAVEVTYLHELTHFILYLMGENELTNNEKFIETFSHLLHQALEDK